MFKNTPFHISIKKKIKEIIEYHNFVIFTECERNYTSLQGRLFGKSLFDCDQYIHVPQNYTITLYFASMDFRIDKDCSDDTMALKVR